MRFRLASGLTVLTGSSEFTTRTVPITGPATANAADATRRFGSPATVMNSLKLAVIEPDCTISSTPSFTGGDADRAAAAGGIVPRDPRARPLATDPGGGREGGRAGGGLVVFVPAPPGVRVLVLRPGDGRARAAPGGAVLRGPAPRREERRGHA